MSDVSMFDRAEVQTTTIDVGAVAPVSPLPCEEYGVRVDASIHRSLAIVLLLGSAYVGSRYAPALLPYSLGMYLLQPALWLVPGLLSLYFVRREIARIWRVSLDHLTLAITVGVLTVAVGVLAGMFIGLGRSPYPHYPLALLLNAWFVGAILVGRELARWYLLSVLRQHGELVSVGVTWLLFWITSLPLVAYTQLSGADTAFPFIGTFLLPAAAIQLLATYFAFRGGPLVSITYLGILASFEWFSPVLPDLAWPVAAMLGVLVPLIGLTILESGSQQQQDVNSANTPETGLSWSWLAASFFLVAVLWFNTGVFGVRPAIVHGTSMLPAMQTGDIAVTRDVHPNDLQIGDVIRFKQGSRIVLHRIIEFSEEDGTPVIIAQGDNNDAPDRPVRYEDVEGQLVLHVPHAGKPGIYFKQALTWVFG